MTFSSPIFLFAFLPLFLVGYFLLFGPALAARGERVRGVMTGAANAFILLTSLVFYFWGETWLVAVMLTSTTIDFCAGLAIGRFGRTARGRAFLVLSIAANLGLLGYFKYAGFAVENLARLAGALGIGADALTDFAEISLPLGISFYTFQSMSYTIDVYRGQVAPTRNFLGFACFVTMFPQLVAGPIVRYRDIAAQVVRRTVSLDGFRYGVVRFVMGLGKKVLVANVVALPADRIFALPAGEVTTGLAWLGTACYTLQIYFDFSGYSDMAIGLGRMLGFTYPENFRYPYAARSIRDFWQRWHISLSSWFRDYLYIPLGGGRVAPRRVYGNLLTVFLLCGLWHGASWSFVAWGLFHGAFLVLERRGLGSLVERLPGPLPRLYVLPVVMVGWVLFRADTLGQAVVFLRAMAGGGADGMIEPTLTAAGLLDRELVLTLLFGAVLSQPVLPLLMRLRDGVRGPLPDLARNGFDLVYGVSRASLVLAVLAVSAMVLAAGSHNPFIYFRF